MPISKFQPFVMVLVGNTLVVVNSVLSNFVNYRSFNRRYYVLHWELFTPPRSVH